MSISEPLWRARCVGTVTRLEIRPSRSYGSIIVGQTDVTKRYWLFLPPRVAKELVAFATFTDVAAELTTMEAEVIFKNLLGKRVNIRWYAREYKDYFGPGKDAVKYDGTIMEVIQ